MAHIVIVGAGPGGAALAFLLARRGIDVTLVERQTDFEREFRGEILMPSGIAAFAQMGLAAAFEALPQARPEFLDLHINGRFVRRVAVPDSLDPPPHAVSQPAMLEMLIEQCQRFSSFDFRRGSTVSDLLHEAGRVVGVRLRGGEHTELRADLVVGADGRASVVRKKAGLEVETDTESFDVVWFKVPPLASIDGSDRAAQAFLRPGQLCLAFPTWDHRLQVAWIIPKGSYGDLKRRGVEEWLDEIAAQVGPLYGPHLTRHRDVLEHPFVLDVLCYVLDRWQRPGVLLLGDAAHPMSPVGGQGLNIALRDAIVAANHLVPRLTGGAAPEAIDAAAAVIESERLPEVAEIVRLQRLPPRFFMSHAFWVKILLRLAPYLVRAIPGGRGAALPSITRTFLYGAREVELRV